MTFLEKIFDSQPSFWTKNGMPSFIPGQYHEGNIEYVTTHVLKFLALVTKAGGRVYGDFIDNVLLPLCSDTYVKTLRFKEVNIWWTSQTAMDAFLKRHVERYASMVKYPHLERPLDNEYLQHGRTYYNHDFLFDG